MNTPEAKKGDWQSRNCPLCGRNQPVAFLRKGDLELQRCRACSMVYLNPVPAACASGEYYDQGAVGYYLSPAKLESDYADVRFERELRLFRQFCTGGAVLDVGCSSGAFLYQLKQRYPGAYRILGTDASGPALDYAVSRGVPVLRGDFLQLRFEAAPFQAITFWAVLEHLLEPGAFLGKAATLLDENGLCFVLVPNLRSLAARLLGSRYRYIYPQHLNYFTSATLARLVEPNFEVVARRFMHFNPVLIWQDWRSGGAEVSNEQRASLLQSTTRLKQNRALVPLKWLYRASEKGLSILHLADNVALVLRNKRGRRPPY